MTATMLLCAGLGTRLRPLTDELPKPLVWLGERPLLASLLTALEPSLVGVVVVNTHHLSCELEAFAASCGRELRISHEQELLGTAGGVQAARELLGPGPCLVWNGDILTQPEPARLRQAVTEAPLALACVPRPQGEGTLGCDDRGRVVRLRGRSFGAEQRGADFVGVSMLSEAARELLPERGCLIGDLAISLLENGQIVQAVEQQAGFRDLGSLESYREAHWQWLKEHSNSEGGSFCGPRVQLSPGVILRRCCLGAGAVVRGHGLLSDVIAWPGAHLEAPRSGQIVTTAGRVA